jgi:hypothetical protein
VTGATPPHRNVHTLRWLFVVPSAFVGWYVGLILALLINSAHKALCPTTYIVSGMCNAPWSAFVQGLAIICGAVFSGALVVLLPALFAPNHRKRVASIAYGLGMLLSVYFLVLIPGIWHAVLSSVTGGGIVLWRFVRRDSAVSKGMT